MPKRPELKRFPWDDASDRVLAMAAELKDNDHSRGAEHLREVAGSVRDHREAAAQRQHWGETEWARQNVGLD